MDNEAFCRRIKRDLAWTEIATWAAEHICKGAVRVPLSPTVDILASYDFCYWDRRIDKVMTRRTDQTLATQSEPTVDELHWKEAR